MAEATKTRVYENQQIETNGITLHVVMAGPQTGEPVILLHGFPEFWYGWRQQIDYLADKGYRVIVPDQRGYNLSDKPTGVDMYTLDVLALDVVGLMDALDYQQVYLVGHDWGAAVAWEVAEIYPDRVQKLAILNVPHPHIVGKALLLGNIKQMFKSWYMLFFQVPSVPETLISSNYDSFGKGLQRSGKAGAFSDDDIERYKEAWAQAGALTAMINWYRAAGRGARRRGERPAPHITPPTLILWGEKDFALESSLADESARICDDAQLIYFPDAGHFVQHDEPDAVNERLANFFAAPMPEKTPAPQEPSARASIPTQTDDDTTSDT